MECHGSGFWSLLKCKSFGSGSKPPEKKGWSSNLSAANGILIIWKVIGSKCNAWILQVRCGARFLWLPVSYQENRDTDIYPSMTTYIVWLHFLVSHLWRHPLLKSNAAQSWSLKKVWDMRAPLDGKSSALSGTLVRKFLPTIFRKKSHLKIHLFSTKRHSKDWTNFEELEENDDISCPFQRKLPVKMAIPCWWSSPFWRCQAFRLVARHRLVGIRDAKDFGSPEKHGK